VEGGGEGWTAERSGAATAITKYEPKPFLEAKLRFRADRTEEVFRLVKTAEEEVLPVVYLVTGHLVHEGVGPPTQTWPLLEYRHRDFSARQPDGRREAGKAATDDEHVRWHGYATYP